MDKYDQAIAYLTAYPNEINSAWNLPEQHTAGVLFKKAGPDNMGCGCLTQIRLEHIECSYMDPRDMYRAVTDELTERIRNDRRIPCRVDGITLESLPIFAELQREVDAEMTRLGFDESSK